MKDNCVLMAESVTEGHPDKLCDTIADAVLDACLALDRSAHVACEVMATAGKIIAAGEITASRFPDIPAVLCQTVREAGYGGADYEVEVITHAQSPDIANRTPVLWKQSRRSSPMRRALISPVPSTAAGSSARGIRVSCTVMPARKRRNFCPCRWCWPTA